MTDNELNLKNALIDILLAVQEISRNMKNEGQDEGMLLCNDAIKSAIAALEKVK